MADGKIFELGPTVLQRGMTVPNAQIIYQTYGELAADRSNAILYPASYGAQHTDRMADWAGAGAGSQPLVHHHPEHVHQRPVIVSQ
jgi:homoserine acetyltransferase